MRNSKSRGTALPIKVLAVFFLAVGIFTVLRIQLKKNEILESTAQLEREYAENLEEIEKLREDLEAPVDRDYLIRVAREKLGLCMPDEIIFYNDLNK